MAQQVNVFLASDQADTLKINNFHWASTGLGFGCILVPCAILGTIALIKYRGGAPLRRWVKAWSPDQAKDSHPDQSPDSPDV
jgi:hypothetical protein